MHSMAMCWLVFGIFFIQSLVSIDAERMKLSQLEKMVADLKASHEIQIKQIFEIQFENAYFKENIEELRAINEKLKRIIHDLQDENRVQKKINSQMKMEITEIKTLLKSSEFEELIIPKSSLLQSDQSKTIVETDRHLKDDYISVETIGTNSSNHGIQQRATAVNSPLRPLSQRLLLTAPPASTPTGVIAFHAYISNDSNGPLSEHHILQFDEVPLNKGNGYRAFDGIFNVPTSGTYVFTWSFMSNYHGGVFTQLIRNGVILGSRFADSTSSTVWDFATGIVVADANQGDHVYVRLGATSQGNVRSIVASRTTFSGWLLS